MHNAHVLHYGQEGHLAGKPLRSAVASRGGRIWDERLPRDERLEARCFAPLLERPPSASPLPKRRREACPRSRRLIRSGSASSMKRTRVSTSFGNLIGLYICASWISVQDIDVHVVEPGHVAANDFRPIVSGYAFEDFVDDLPGPGEGRFGVGDSRNPTSCSPRADHIPQADSDAILLKADGIRFRGRSRRASYRPCNDRWLLRGVRGKCSP